MNRPRERTGLLGCLLLATCGAGCGPPVDQCDLPAVSATSHREDAVGHCYENSLKLIILANSEGSPYRERFLHAGLNPAEAVLVHGVATHQGQGFRYGHAWVEVGQIVIDVARSLDAPVYIGSKDAYYQLGKLQAEECKCYGLLKGKLMLEQYGHWGPWYPLPAGVREVWASTEQEREARRRNTDRAH